MAEPVPSREFDWARLSRRPDVEAPNLFASDAADRLILDTAAPLLVGLTPRDVVVVGDAYGALALAATALTTSTTEACESAGARIRVHQDTIVAERALAENAQRFVLSDAYRSCGLDGDLAAGARVILLRLPKSLDALDEIAGILASAAHPEVVIVAGGMQKHMTVAMNDVLGHYFERVDVGHGRQKARVLTVRGARTAARTAPVPARTLARIGQELPVDGADPSESERGGGGSSLEPAWPRREFHGDIAPGLWVCAHGGAFAGTRIDIGTRFLLSHLDEIDETGPARDPLIVVDLACGTGVLAATFALRHPHSQVIATDQSAAAAASARATADANGVADRVQVRREDAGEGIPTGSADVVLLNPPFHNGAALDLRIGRMLVAAAARMLAPGGELWTVYNSHLDYRPSLRRFVGPTRQIDRNAKFTITASVRGGVSSPA
jgi:16S rRNA (guanine1207-N2)-methyltransferase